MRLDIDYNAITNIIHSIHTIVQPIRIKFKLNFESKNMSVNTSHLRKIKGTKNRKFHKKLAKFILQSLKAFENQVIPLNKF